MSSIGQKIKEALTGHQEHDNSGVKTPDVNAPGAFPSDEPATKHHADHNKLTKESPGQGHPENTADVERGAQHHTGHSHHDPEPETKQSTSEAGNYPYWGNLPREGGEHVHRAEGSGIGAAEQRHGLSNDSSLATGALAAGAGTAGVGYVASQGSRDHDAARTNERIRAEADRDSSLGKKEESNTHQGAGAGLAGATYLATRDKADASTRNEKRSAPEVANASAQSETGTAVRHTQTLAPTQKPAETATPTKTTSSGDNNSHRKEAEALAAGAGAAGLAGAGYYASQKGDNPHDTTRDTGSYGTQGYSTQNPSHTTTPAGRHDPVTEAQKATSAAGNYPYHGNDHNADRATRGTGLAEAATPTKTTSSGDNESHRKEQALASGAGASGVAGVGYLASKKLDDRENGRQFAPTSGQTTSGVQASSAEHRLHGTSGHHDPEHDAKRATSGAGNYPHWDNDNREHDNNRGLAATGAGVGLGGAGVAGAGLLASRGTDERRDDLRRDTRETSSGAAAPASLAQRDTTSRQIDHSTSGGIHNTVVGAGSSEYSSPPSSSNTTGASHQPVPFIHHSQPAAQAAAQQAWSKQEPTSYNTADDTSYNNKRSDLGHAAAGTAFGAGAAGLAAQYGQGEEHENNPRTDKSERIADRALGSDGKPHAPSSTQGLGSGAERGQSSGLSSGFTGLAGKSGSTGDGSKVLHKCDNCGHDNDISRYFNKDAVFRSQ